jgi:hypothetical protein
MNSTVGGRTTGSSEEEPNADDSITFNDDGFANVID